ncbi:HAMP domain-containing histidine kinase [Massilia sp. Dwa41.01b]|uniref:sensor histidine kinase n=1 Tax=Massilia sp. Dwa41.01b TaxID=2709302 RepID=UPI0015FEC318|nr:HAMP domain-containing sensor histidine kinase [Massilia sp. Dwa41.01b]QNA89098.1 HAMP domain-containing histidine kinase [Massilia sp. Dwa41.01b]
MLGHELRNPLAPIGTAAQLLKMPDVDGHRARYAGDVIGRQVEHMNRLLSDMLDVSRVTRGLVTLSLEDVDLRDVVERAVEQTRPLLEERQHRLELRLPPNPVMVRGDQTRLTQVVANLLTNSAKYTPPHGDIQLDLISAGMEATLTVADDGEGITAELLPRVFDLFSQGERKADRARGGLGLGLAPGAQPDPAARRQRRGQQPGARRRQHLHRQAAAQARAGGAGHAGRPGRPRPVARCRRRCA